MKLGVDSLTRRGVLASGAAAVGLLAAPSVLRAQSSAIKIGLLQPLTGPLALDGELAVLGARTAVEEINAAGGLKSLGGAKLELVVGDSRSNAEHAAQETEALIAQGVAIVLGGFGSAMALTGSQAAARHDVPFVVDCAVADAITERGLKNTFRLCPSFTMATDIALKNLVRLNDEAGKPAKTAVIVHEDGLFGSGFAALMQKNLPAAGFEVLDTLSHPTPARDMSNLALRLRSLKPDLILPSHYFNEFVLMMRTLQQQRIKAMGIYAVFGGAASSYRFVKEFPELAEGVMDCNHWSTPDHPQSINLRKKVEAAGKFYAYNAPINYSLIYLAAQALEKAGGPDRAKLIATLATEEFDSAIMPYTTTKFNEKGQNTGALAVNTQVQDGDIKVIFPDAIAQAKPRFPVA